MASTPKLLSIIFLLSLFSIQIHSREFFSKIPRENNNAQEPTVSVPNKEEPSFTPQTQNGYGLYGPETNTRGTYQPYVTPVKFHPDEPYNMIPESNNNNKDSYFHSKSADQSTHKENLGEARFTEKGWSTEQNHNNYYNGNNEEDTFTEKGWSAKENNKNNYYNAGNEYNKNAYGEAMFREKGWNTKENSKNNNYYNGNNGYNGEKQGMSDTRFLENGKYFHDIRNENNYYPNQFESSRGFASRNEFNENRYKNMGRYNQNQEEFEENEEEFEP